MRREALGQKIVLHGQTDRRTEPGADTAAPGLGTAGELQREPRGCSGLGVLTWGGESFRDTSELLRGLKGLQDRDWGQGKEGQEQGMASHLNK